MSVLRRDLGRAVTEPLADSRDGGSTLDHPRGERMAQG